MTVFVVLEEFTTKNPLIKDVFFTQNAAERYVETLEPARYRIERFEVKH